jgi:hypothetical protein
VLGVRKVQSILFAPILNGRNSPVRTKLYPEVNAVESESNNSQWTNHTVWKRKLRWVLVVAKAGDTALLRFPPKIDETPVKVSLD